MERINRHQQWNYRYKVKRALWNFTWLFLFRPTPKMLAKNWRNFLLKRFGCTIKGEALVCPSVKILAPWNLVLGDYIAIGEGVNIYNHALVDIGANVVISQGSELCTSSHDHAKNSMPLIASPITIKDHAWVTTKCFIHPGVTIGEGAVIGACSVVIKDITDWTINAGNPCKRIKKRDFNFNE